MARTLSGGCSCGRNHYLIQLPEDSASSAQVLFDNSHIHRHDTASLLSAYLRVPLPWVQSTTYAFFPDETHSSIRKVYTSPTDTTSKRHFCGFCGTPLSHWTESPRSEAEFISLTLGSLASDDLRDLETLGLLPQEASEDWDAPSTAVARQTGSAGQLTQASVPWFESMIAGSGLGRVKRSKGSRTEGNTKVEWEVVEWTGGDDEQTANISKRKLGSLESEDSVMDGLH